MSGPRDGSDAAELLARAEQGERRAVARLLTYVERGGPAAEDLDRLLLTRPHRSHVVGITGAPGAGKSTLTGRLVDDLVAAGRRVAVLAVDPSSPRTGGAILGDRIRMESGPSAGADGVFIRSVASRGQHGGLSIAVPAMVRLLEATGADLVIVETVGVGQIELDIAALADTTAVVLTPGWGDAIQANKAGVLEVADVFVVNKADRPGAADTVRDLDHMLDLDPERATRRPPIVRTVATTADGVAALRDAIDAHRSELDASGERELRRHRRDRAELRARVERLYARAIDDALDAQEGIVDAVGARTCTVTDAACDLAARVRPPSPPAPRRASAPRPRPSP